MFRRSFKEKCPLSGAKTRVQSVNPGTFYYIEIGTYYGGSEFKYPWTVIKNECSIVLEICPTPNPSLNLPDSVNKCKTDIKTHLLMHPCYLNFLICRFELLYRTVVTRDSNQNTSLYSVNYQTNLQPTNLQPTVYKNPYIKLDMGNASVQSIRFQIPQHINIVITWSSSSNCAKITLY